MKRLLISVATISLITMLVAAEPLPFGPPSSVMDNDQINNQERAMQESSAAADAIGETLNSDDVNSDDVIESLNLDENQLADINFQDLIFNADDGKFYDIAGNEVELMAVLGDDDKPVKDESGTEILDSFGKPYLSAKNGNIYDSKGILTFSGDQLAEATAQLEPTEEAPEGEESLPTPAESNAEMDAIELYQPAESN